MKAISLWQPWATLMAVGAKAVETRSWAPRGLRVGDRFAIHAAKKQDADSLFLCVEEPFRTVLVERAGIEFVRDLPFGAIVATVQLGGVYRTESIRDSLSEDERAFGDYRDGRYGWFTVDCRRLAEPIPCRGAQGLWDVPADLLPLLT